MTASTATVCGHCHRDLAANQRGKHCQSRTCTWLKCSCGAAVDTKAGRHIHTSHEGPRPSWPCTRKDTR